MKIGLTIIIGGVGGDKLDANPAPIEELQVEVVLPEQDTPVVVDPVVVVDDPVVVVVDPTPPVVVVPDTAPEEEPSTIPDEAPDPVVVVPPADVEGRTIHEMPTLQVNNPELYVNFNDKDDGPYSASQADNDFNFKWQSFSAKTSEIINKRWAVTVPKDQIKKGIHAAKDLIGQNEYYFGYEIEFSQGYDLANNHGGKLPGMVGLNKSLKKSSGSQVYPDGCNALGQRRDEGFSLRSMFRKDGRMIGYFYHEDNPEMLPGGNNSCGHEVDYIHEGQKFYVQKGVRYFIETRCKMNSKYASDGIVQIWVNGFLVVSMTSMRLSHSLLYDINHMFIYFWHGGSSSTWEPSVDSQVFLDNFILQRTPISH